MELYRRLLMALGVLMLTACASGPGPMPDQLQPVSGTTDEYRIGVDDLVSVQVWRNEDLSVSVPVRPDGRISVPLVGDVQAGGQTPKQVASAIENELKRYIREPRVTVIVTELRSHEFLNRVRVTGAVEQPVTLPYRQGMTVLDLVLEAGGVTEFASPNGARLHRRGTDGNQVMKVELGKILEDGELSTNYYLQPGDIVTVPERFF